MTSEIPEKTCTRGTVMDFLHEIYAPDMVYQTGVKLWLSYFGSLHIFKDNQGGTIPKGLSSDLRKFVAKL